MRRVAPLLVLVALTGCGKSDQLFPLRIGNEWTYNVKSGLSEFVSKVTVSRNIPVAGVQGFELSSPMGISRLVWKGDILYATVLSGSRFNPPLPMLNASEEKHTFRQAVRMYSGGKTYEAEATVAQETQTHTRDGRKFKATMTTTLLRMKDREVEIKSVYAPGIGLVEQTQRTQAVAGGSRKLFDLQMDCISGP